MHLRHRWVEVEQIGRVVTERCTVCLRTRTRLRGPVRDSPGFGVQRPVTDPENGSTAATGAPTPLSADLRNAVPHRTCLEQYQRWVTDQQSPDYHG